MSSLTIPDSVTSIGNHTFRNSPALTSLYIPKSVTSIGVNSFNNCDAFTTVYYGGNQEDRAKIDIDSSRNAIFENATWIYNSTGLATGTTPPTETPTPESSTYPTWATLYIDFVAEDIMPDISTENCDLASNRGLIAQCLYNMCGDGGAYSSNFTDVGNHTNAIGWCFANRVMAGNSDTFFDTEGNVTREQFALILMKLAEVTEKTTASGDTSTLEQFADKDSISSWAESGIAWAVANGLMQGSGGNLDPSGNITRTEVAVMLYNFDKL